jgi:uncharacterized protein YlxW (UPF0749 family)
VEAGLPAATSTRTPLVLASAVVVGLLLTMGALSLRRPEPVAAKAKAELVAQIEARRADADARARAVQQLQAEVDRAQAEALGGGQAALARQLSALARATGSEPVTGPGLVLTLDDARTDGSGSADGNPRTQAQADEGRVLSKDLQVVVNGLWEAGAEAIAINGQRLTPRSAIRFAGEAILVNYRPLTRPYVISAIGPESLEVELADTPGGAYLRALEDNYGVQVDVTRSERLTLPAATSLTVRSAAPPTPTSTPSVPPTGAVPSGTRTAPVTEPSAPSATTASEPAP